MLSAQVSIGGGGLFGVQFKKYSYHAGKSLIDTTYIHGGGFAFFDATYIELSLGARLGKDNFDNAKETMLGFNTTYLFLGVMGKYPITTSSGIIIFPMAGVEYDLAIIRNDIGTGKSDFSGNRSIADFSRLWIKAGAGADINLTRSFYIRPSALYAFGLNNAKDKRDVESFFFVKSIMHHGIDLRLAAGFRF
jgi:opacity protein-like surface antigen